MHVRTPTSRSITKRPVALTAPFDSVGAAFVSEIHHASAVNITLNNRVNMNDKKPCLP